MEGQVRRGDGYAIFRNRFKTVEAVRPGGVQQAVLLPMQILFGARCVLAYDARQMTR